MDLLNAKRLIAASVILSAWGVSLAISIRKLRAREEYVRKGNAAIAEAQKHGIKRALWDSEIEEFASGN